MEVLVCNNRLHALITKVRGDIRVRKYTRGIEDIEALVLHRPHIKVIDGNDIEKIKIVFKPVPLLVPAHRSFQRCHCMFAITYILCFDPDAEIDRLARSGCERVRNQLEITRNNGKEIAGLRVWVMPNDGVSIVVCWASANFIAVT